MSSIAVEVQEKLRSQVAYQNSPIQSYLHELLKKIDELKENHAEDTSVEKKEAEKLLDGAKAIIELIDKSILPAFSKGAIPGLGTMASLIREAWSLRGTFNELIQLMGEKSKKTNEQMISHPMLYDFINHAITEIANTPETFTAFMPFLNPEALNIDTKASFVLSFLPIAFSIKRESQDSEYSYIMNVEKKHTPVGLSQVNDLPPLEALKDKTQDHFYLTSKRLSLYNYEEKQFVHFELTDKEAEALSQDYPQDSKISSLSEPQRTKLAKVMVASDVNDWGLRTETVFENGLMKVTTKMDLSNMYAATKKKLPSLLNERLNEGNELLQELLAVELDSLRPEQNIEFANLSLEDLNSALNLAQNNLSKLSKKQEAYEYFSCKDFLDAYHPDLLEKHQENSSNKVALAKLLPKTIIGCKPNSPQAERIEIKTAMVAACSLKIQELEERTLRLDQEMQAKLIREVKSYKESKIAELKEDLAKLSSHPLPNVEANKEELHIALKNLKKAQEDLQATCEKIAEAQRKAKKDAKEKINLIHDIKAETNQAIKQELSDLDKAFTEGLQRCSNEEKQLTIKIQKLENMILLKDINLETLEAQKTQAEEEFPQKLEKALEENKARRIALESKKIQAEKDLQSAEANYDTEAPDFRAKQEALEQKRKGIDFDLALVAVLKDKIDQANAKEGLDFSALDLLIRNYLNPQNQEEDLFDALKAKAQALFESETIDFLGFNEDDKKELQAYKRKQMRPVFKPEPEENAKKIQLMKDKIAEKEAALKEERTTTLTQLGTENSREISLIEATTKAQKALHLAQENLASLAHDFTLEETMRAKQDKSVAVLSQLIEFFQAQAELSANIETTQNTLSFNPLEAKKFNPEAINVLLKAQEALKEKLTSQETSLNQLEEDDNLRATLGVIKPLVENTQKGIDSLLREKFDLKPMEEQLTAIITEINAWKVKFEILEKDHAIAATQRLEQLTALIEKHEELAIKREKALESVWNLAETLDEIQQDPKTFKTQVNAIGQAFDILIQSKETLDSNLESMKKAKASHEKRQEFTNRLIEELKAYRDARKTKDSLFTKAKIHCFPEDEANRIKFINDLIEGLKKYQASDLDEDAIAIRALIKENRACYPSKRLQPILSRVCVEIHDYKYPNANRAKPLDKEPYTGVERVIHEYFKPYLNSLESHFKDRVENLIQGIEKDLKTDGIKDEVFKDLINDRLESLDDETEAQTPAWRDLVNRLKAVLVHASLSIAKKLAPSIADFMSKSSLFFTPRQQLIQELSENIKQAEPEATKIPGLA